MTFYTAMPMALFLPPLADAGDIIKALVTVLFIVFWIAGQFLGEKKKAGQKAAPKPRPKPARPPQPARGPQQPPRRAPAGDPLADEIEEFLRRAAGGRNPEPVQRGAAEQPDEVQVLVPRRERQVRSPRQTEERRPMSAPLSERQASTSAQPSRSQGQASGGPETVDPASDVGNRVADHVEQHIAPSSHAERISHLGEEVGLADDRLESRLHQTFDHAVGQLVHRETVTGRDQVSPLAASVAKMFSSPETARQVIVLNEILKRPDERW